MKHETRLTDFPVCPYCGTEDKDWQRYFWGQPPEDGEEWVSRCRVCDKLFSGQVDVIYRFTTKKNGSKEV